MIRVTVYKDKRHAYKGFDLTGHAEHGEAGHDVVCAAVSSLVINTINSVEAFTQDETSCRSEEESGTIEFRFQNQPTHDASLLVDSMLLGLQGIEESSEYEPYIDIIFKEV